MRKHLKDTKGITLIEIIVTMAILGIIVVAGLNAYMPALNGVVSASTRNEMSETLSGISDSLLADSFSTDAGNPTAVITEIENIISGYGTQLGITTSNVAASSYSTPADGTVRTIQYKVTNKTATITKTSDSSILEANLPIFMVEMRYYYANTFVDTAFYIQDKAYN